MSRWWRAYDEAVDDPKLQKLPAELFRGWFNICCITSQNGGVLPSAEDIAFKLRTTPAKAAKLLDDLRAAGLIDDHVDGNVSPHNWDGRQFKSDSSTDRVKRFRNGQRNVSSDKNGNAPEQNRAEQKQSAPPRDDSDFEEWYRIYPRREGRGHALKAYRTARKSIEAAVLLEGSKKAAARYSGSDQKFIPLPATWLNGQRWLDEAPEKSNRIAGII